MAIERIVQAEEPDQEDQELNGAWATLDALVAEF